MRTYPVRLQAAFQSTASSGSGSSSGSSSSGASDSGSRDMSTAVRKKVKVNKNAGTSTMVLPDYNTSVNVADIKLTKAKRPGSWKGLDDLKQRTSGSLIADTLKEMEGDAEFQLNAKRLRELGQKKLTMQEKKNRRRALTELGVPQFREFLAEQNLMPKRKPAEVFQLNIGLYCNQACNHCHVESSPKRKEMMDEATAMRCIEIIKNSPSIKTLDITGGAPEMNDQFRPIVEAASAARPDIEIIDRCNLTVLAEPGHEDLPEFLAKHKVRVAASLPCYSAKNVNMQRGNNVFDRSIQGLIKLNEAGYGVEGSGLYLDLVYNPLGAFLPPPQEALQAKYKEELLENFGIEFNDLFTMTNMPIKRFADFLYRRGELKDYMDLLVRNFNPDTTETLMCTNTLNVGWDGRIFDCDFNQQLELDLQAPNDADAVADVFTIESVQDLVSQAPMVDSHCFGCTAGMGSS